jgi:hypothetical protein
MTHHAHTINYSITRGLPWQRLIIVKDRRTHKQVKPTDARSYIQTGPLAKKELTVDLTSENGIMLSLSAEETQDLPLGELDYDVIATINDIQRPVAKGTIIVSALDLITPMEDAQIMEIRYKQRTDFRLTYTWNDPSGGILAVQNAYMQAKDTTGATVLDLRWFATTPSEATVIALPAVRRGYLAPYTNSTLELHISDQNTIAAGSYSFDLFVQDTSGDWDCLASGSLVVEPSISAPPA